MTDTSRVRTGPEQTTSSGPVARVRGPRWRDPRLIVGVLLVLVSAAVGARLFASGDDTTRVWVAARNLDAGTVLAAGDLERTSVRLLDAGSRYVSSDSRPVGYVLTRAVGDGELLPKAALAQPGEATAHRFVTVPVQRGHLPPNLAAGERVDVFATASTNGTIPAAPRLVVSAALVSKIDRGGSGLAAGGREIGVVLSVPPDVVDDVVGAIRGGKVDLARVPLGADVSATASP